MDKTIKPVTELRQALVTRATAFTLDKVTIAAYELIQNSETPVMDYAKLRLIAKGVTEVLKDKEIIGIVEEGLKDFPADGVAGIKVSAKDTATKYDFTVCNHPEWERIEQLISILKDRQKVIEDELKGLYRTAVNNTNVKSAGKRTKTIVVETLPELVDEPYGEVCEVNPPLKSSSRSIYVTTK